MGPHRQDLHDRAVEGIWGLAIVGGFVPVEWVVYISMKYMNCELTPFGGGHNESGKFHYLMFGPILLSQI